MNTSRVWTLGTVVACLAIVGAAVGLGVQPQLAAASAADAETVAVDSQTTATRLELARLSRLAATESALETTDSKLGSAITGSLRLSTFSRQVRDTAALDGVTLISLNPATALPYAPTSAVPAGSSTSNAAASAASSGLFGRTSSLITADNFTLIPVTVAVTGSEAATMQFASDVQHMNRLFAVDTVNYTNGTGGAAQTTTLSGNIYALKQN